MHSSVDAKGCWVPFRKKARWSKQTAMLLQSTHYYNTHPPTTAKFNHSEAEHCPFFGEDDAGLAVNTRRDLLPDPGSQYIHHKWGSTSRVPVSLLLPAGHQPMLTTRKA